MLQHKIIEYRKYDEVTSKNYEQMTSQSYMIIINQSETFSGLGLIVIYFIRFEIFIS